MRLTGCCATFTHDQPAVVDVTSEAEVAAEGADVDDGVSRHGRDLRSGGARPSRMPGLLGGLAGSVNPEACTKWPITDSQEAAVFLVRGYPTGNAVGRVSRVKSHRRASAQDGNVGLSPTAPASVITKTKV